MNGSVHYGDLLPTIYQMQGFRFSVDVSSGIIYGFNIIFDNFEIQRQLMAEKVQRSPKVAFYSQATGRKTPK